MKTLPPWYEETQQALEELKNSDPIAFLMWTTYCREMLGRDPNIVPPAWLKKWLELPISRRAIGY